MKVEYLEKLENGREERSETPIAIRYEESNEQEKAMQSEN